MAIEIDGETYLDQNEACRLLGVKAATLYAYVSRGMLKSYKQGIKRQRLYKKSQLEALLQLRPSDEPLPGAPESGETAGEEEAEKNKIPRAEDWIPYY